MRLKFLFLMILSFILISQIGFGWKIKKKDADLAWKEFQDKLELVEKKGVMEQAPQEALIVKSLIEEIQKDIKEEEWEWIYQKSKVASSYLLLIQSIAEFKEAEKLYEEIRQK